MKHSPLPAWDLEAAPTFWVNHASRLLMRHFERRLRVLDFGMAYLPVVAALQEHGPLTQRQLAELARVEQPTMANLLDRMERDAVIARRPPAAGRRGAPITLSAGDEQRLPLAQAQLSAVAERALTDFSAEERAALTALLRRVVDNLERADDA